jgi:hypothetical protein
MLLDRIVHRLAAAIQFVDAFTTRDVEVPLVVEATTLPIAAGMPNVPWKAIRARNDSTYRLFVTNQTVPPVGGVQLSVEAPGHEYFNFEPLIVALPRVLVAHPPTPARSDFVVRHELWPTRSLRLPPRETTILARFVTAGATPIARLRVTIWPNGLPMPAAPYGYTNDNGELVFRLPDLKTVNGGVITTTAALQIDVRLPPLYAASVVPTLVTIDTGVILGIPFSVRLGQATSLTISLP